MLSKNTALALRIYAWLTVGLFALALGLSLWNRYQGNEYPYDTFLFDPDYRFSDLTMYQERLRAAAAPSAFFSGQGPLFNYGAPAFAFVWWLSRWFGHPVYWLLGAVLVAVVMGLCFLWNSIRRRGLVWPFVVTLGCCYPVMFAVDRCNLELVVWVLIAWSIWCYVAGRYNFAAAGIGLVASCKFFPALLFLLLLRKGKWRSLGLGLVVFGGATLAALYWIGPSIEGAARHIGDGLAKFTKDYAVSWREGEVGFDHSIFSLWRAMGYWRFGDTEELEDILRQTYLMYAAAAGGGFLLLYWLRLRKLPVLNCVIACLTGMICLPFVSYDYTLVHLYVVFALYLVFLTSTGCRFTLHQMLGGLIPLAILLTPQSWILWDDVGYGGQIKALMLLWFLLYAALYPMPLAMLDEAR